MKKAILSFGLCAVAALAQAQVATQTVSAATTGLSMPTTVTMSAALGSAVSTTVKVTNLGPGFASNLVASLAQAGSTGDNASLAISADTCTGATLAVNGSCTIKLSGWSACPVKMIDQWTLSVAASSGQSAGTQVRINSLGGECR